MKSRHPWWASAALALLVALACPLRADSAVDPVGEWPLQPRPDVVEGFDPPESTWGPGHRGADLAGRPGQPVRAALGGRVSFVGAVAGRPVIAVSHGDTRTTYEPVASSLAQGTRVAAGQVIGSLVTTGSHCFPRACLHWGWIRGATYLDPLRLVGGGPVRLLPLDGLPGDSGPRSATAAAQFRPVRTPYHAWQPLLRVLHPGVQP